MVKQIEIISNSSFRNAQDRINDFLKTHPEAKILGLHPKSLADGAGIVAVLSYTGTLKPYQVLEADLGASTKELLKQKDALTESRKIASGYQLDSQKAKDALIRAKDEINSLRKALKKESPTEDKLDEYDFAIEKISQAWIDQYEEATGSKAIWKGEVTKGFKHYAKSNLIK